MKIKPTLKINFMKKIIKTFATTLTISLAFSSTAQARIITSISPPGGAGQGDVFCSQVQTSVDTVFPNSSGNEINNFPGLSCTPKTFREIAPIDTNLFVETSGGTTEYLLNETVVNSTESIWDGYNIAIGFSSENPFGGDSFASPAQILLRRGTAIPSFNNTQTTSSEFSQLADGSYNLNWSGGTVAPGETVDFTFSIAVPDDDFEGNNYDSFTIRQLPIASGMNQSQSVPEPSLVFGFLGLIGFGFANKRKL